MPTAHDAIDAAIVEVTTARARVRKIATPQVRGVDDVATLKATAQTWFFTHKPLVVFGAPGLDLSFADRHYTTVLNATTKLAAKQTYLQALKDAKAALVTIRAAALGAQVPIGTPGTDDLAPDFGPLAGSPEMRDILVRRWGECTKCVKADAHLAAIVMMGGLLEALFVARANAMGDKTPLLAAPSAPDDPETGKKLNYQKWMLDTYIKVGRELNWITESAKNVADTLKEYRNYIHPEKERRHGVILGFNDSTMFWQVTKALVRQLLVSMRAS